MMEALAAHSAPAEGRVPLPPDEMFENEMGPHDEPRTS